MNGFWLGPAPVHSSRLPPTTTARLRRTATCVGTGLTLALGLASTAAAQTGATVAPDATTPAAATSATTTGNSPNTNPAPIAANAPSDPSSLPPEPAPAPASAPTAAGAPPSTTSPRTFFTKDIRHSALTAAPGTLELGVFSYGKYALNERIELALHPIGFLLWPQLEAKLRWFDDGELTVSSLHAVSYPTWFLGAVAREGTGGLVDPTLDLPTTFQTDVQLLATWRLGPSSFGTVAPFAQVRLGGQAPLLEFPFLYQRLAAANAGWVAGLNTALEGVIEDAVGYEFSATYTYLPVESVKHAFAAEAVMEARLLLSQASTIPIGVRFAHAQFPYGRQSHWFPYIDYRLVW